MSRLELIMENLKAAVEGINGTGSFVNVAKFVSRDAVAPESLTSSQFPAVFPMVVSWEDETDPSLVNTEEVSCTLDVEFWALILAQKDRSKAFLSFCADIYRAVMADPRRGENAMDTLPDGAPDVDEVTLAPRGIVDGVMRFRVRFTHALGNMD
jgi:hypothetical protein